MYMLKLEKYTSKREPTENKSTKYTIYMYIVLGTHYMYGAV